MECLFYYSKLYIYFSFLYRFFLFYRLELKIFPVQDIIKENSKYYFKILFQNTISNSIPNTF